MSWSQEKNFILGLVISMLVVFPSTLLGFRNCEQDIINPIFSTRTLKCSRGIPPTFSLNDQ